MKTDLRPYHWHTNNTEYSEWDLVEVERRLTMLKEHAKKVLPKDDMEILLREIEFLEGKLK